jgi:hypothetical protein
MHTSGNKRSIRSAFLRLGLHARPKGIVYALAQQGIRVDEELVRQVQIELVRETTGARISKVPRPVAPPAVRRRPQGFPGL